MSLAYLSLGGNIGDRLSYLECAEERLRLNAGNVLKASSYYITSPWGYACQDDFLNKVLQIETTLDPLALLMCILEIEEQLDRSRTGSKYEARTIDIDILFFENLRLNDPQLVIPHPAIHLRRFTLVPLNEIADNFVHPELKQPIAELLRLCPDTLKVERYKKEEIIENFKLTNIA